MWAEFEERRPCCAGSLRVVGILLLFVLVLFIGGFTEYLYADLTVNPYDTFLLASVTQSINFTRSVCRTPIKSALCAQPRYLDTIPVQSAAFNFARQRAPATDMLIEMCMQVLPTTLTGEEAFVRGTVVRGHILRVVQTRSSLHLFIGAADEVSAPYPVDMASLGSAATRGLYNATRSAPRIAEALAGGLYSTRGVDIDRLFKELAEIRAMPDGEPRGVTGCSMLVSRFTRGSAPRTKAGTRLNRVFSSVKRILQSDMLRQNASIAYNKLTRMKVMGVKGFGTQKCRCTPPADRDGTVYPDRATRNAAYREWEQCCYAEAEWAVPESGVFHDGSTNTLVVPSFAADMGAHSHSTLAYGGVASVLSEGLFRAISPVSLMQGPAGEFIPPDAVPYLSPVPYNDGCLLDNMRLKPFRVSVDVAYRAAKQDSTHLHHSIPGKSIFQSGMSQFWAPTVQYACFLRMSSEELDNIFAYWKEYKSDMTCSGTVLVCNITTAYRSLR